MRRLLLFFLLLLGGVFGGRLDAFSEFQGPSGVRDDTVIVVGIGRPVITLRLRAVFSPALFNTSLHIGNVLLIDSSRVRLQSATYETIVPGRLGRDIIDVDGIRWLGLIDMAQRLPTATATAVKNAWIDGWIYVGSGSHAEGFWERAKITRHGIYWLPPLLGEEEEEEQNPLATTVITKQQAHHSCLAARYDVRPVAELEGRLLGTPVRVLIAPDHTMSYLPSQLFDAYFHDKNLHSDVPERWKPLDLELGESTLLTISGHILFPRQATEMRTGTAYPGALGGKVVRAIVSVEGAMASSEGRSALVATASGMDNLKVMAHACDPDTVVLGGHVLWATSDLEFDYRKGLVRLVPNHTIVSLRLGDVLGLIGILLLYLRWKLGAFWIDRALDRRQPTRYLYYHVTTVDSYLAPIISQFFIVPLLLWRHWNDIWHQLPEDRVEIYLASLGGLWFGANVVWLLVERAPLARAVQVTRKGMRCCCGRRRSAFFSAFYEAFVQDEEEGDRSKSSKRPQHRPDESRRLEMAHRSSGLPPYAHDHASFAWQRLALGQLRDSLLEATLLLSLWSVVAPLESEGFAYFFSAVLFSVVAFMAALRTLMQLLLATTVSAEERPLVTTLALGALAVGLLLLTVKVALRPAFESLSTVYTNNDENLDVLVLFFVASLLFLALTAAPRIINAFSVPKEEEEDGRNPSGSSRNLSAQTRRALAYDHDLGGAF